MLYLLVPQEHHGELETAQKIFELKTHWASDSCSAMQWLCGRRASISSSVKMEAIFSLAPRQEHSVIWRFYKITTLETYHGAYCLVHSKGLINAQWINNWCSIHALLVFLIFPKILKWVVIWKQQILPDKVMSFSSLPFLFFLLLTRQMSYLSTF